MGYKDPKKQREYQNQWMRARRSAWIEANGPCVDCGSWENPEVDHVDPSSKSMHTANIWSRKKEVRDMELAKCVVRCKSCHIEKTKPEHLKGEDQPNSKLTNEQVLEIRSSLEKASVLIEKLGISKTTFYKVKRGEIWKHLE